MSERTAARVKPARLTTQEAAMLRRAATCAEILRRSITPKTLGYGSIRDASKALRRAAALILE